MKLLRSVFVTLFIAYSFAIMLSGASALLTGTGPRLLTLGMFLSGAGPALFFLLAFTKPKARTSSHPLGYSLICGLGVAITMSQSWKFGTVAGSAHLWSGACLAGWMIYLKWYSVFDRRQQHQLKVGTSLPEFSLLTQDGKPITSENLRGKSHILLFYRGNWCPFCTAQIQELAAQYQQVAELGAEIVLISSQPRHEHRKLAERFDLPMTLLRDPDNSAANNLGILQSWGTPFGLQLFGYPSDNSQPAVIVTDPQGQILWYQLAENYRIRAEPATYLDVLRKFQATTNT